MKFRNAVARHLSTDPEQQIAQVLNPGEQNTTRCCFEQPTCPQHDMTWDGDMANSSSLFSLEEVEEGARHDTAAKESVSLIVFVPCLGSSLSNARHPCARKALSKQGQHVISPSGSA